MRQAAETRSTRSDEDLVAARGNLLLARLSKPPPGYLSDSLYNGIIDLATGGEQLKVALFRFVDTLPALKSPEAVAQHLEQYLTHQDRALPPGLTKILRTLGSTGATRRLLAFMAQQGARILARRFIAGADAAEAVVALKRLRRQNLAFTLDLLGEAVISEQEALAYQQKYLTLLRDLASLHLPNNPQTDDAPFDSVPKVNVSIKLSSLYSRFDPMAADATCEIVKDRLRPILSLAREQGAFINFDMEQHDFCALTQRVFQEILCEDAYRDWPDVGVVAQAYLTRTEEDLRHLADWARRRGTPVTVRLVKGAYWDYETIVAAQRGHPVPVFQRKAETDVSFERCTTLLLENWRVLRAAIATHNVRSAAHAQAAAERQGLAPRTVEYQVLFGMGEPIGRALASLGERVRVYVPLGELLPGMAYLVRRLLENSSNDSFVKHLRSKDVDAATLLADPATAIPAWDPAQTAPQPFQNEPETDFAVPQSQQQMRDALAAVRERLGGTVPIVIDGQREEGHLRERYDPSDTSRVASRTHFATVEQAQRAIASAHRTFPQWRDTPVSERAEMLRRVAAEFGRRRFEIAAWQVYEVGKTWREADGDIAEAIDFCRFYAMEMERLAVTRRRDVPGEWNEYFYEGRGPAAIIAPWNFPLAILTGMASAALASGNSVVMKPSEQSSRVGYFLMEALEAAGVPAGVANFLPGEGETVGPVLVNDPRTAIIAFTGSKAVGLSVLRDAAEVRPGQCEIKRVVAEMGGKNAIIVDEDADLDEAVLGVLVSATGYAGQKCSACSRVLVIGSAYEPFCTRLAEAVKSIQIGPAEDPATTLGPAVDRSAQERIYRSIEIGQDEGRLLVSAPPPDGLKDRGYYVPAAVFVDCPPDGHLCQEEIFGPVLVVLRVKNLDEALSLADNTLYALTGGLYTRLPDTIRRVRDEFKVGNLYINRKITGALVDRQPFGGTRLSGVGSKAGGPDYLLQFLAPRVITESVMRRGFAPSTEMGSQGI